MTEEQPSSTDQQEPDPEEPGASREEESVDDPSGGDPGASVPEREGDETGEGSVEEDEAEHLSAEIREELEELDELRDRHLRLAAEFENFRKRTRKEMAQARERAQADLADRLLEALDDLNRFLETPEESTGVESLRAGVEMVYRKLTKELADAGLSRMEPEGERFDPEYHDALLTTPVDDPDEDQIVSRVLIDGYTFGDRVLRPARVEVKKHRPEEDDEAASDEEAADEG